MSLLRRLILIAAMIAVASNVLTSVAFAQERITQFDSLISIQADTSIRITETIDYTTQQAKHGIYRYIPLRYSRGGANETTRITDISVSNATGEPIPFETSRDSENLTLKIGDPDRTFQGEQTYVIAYTVHNAVGLVDDPEPVPELYWDITGEGWKVDIASTTATLISEPATITKTACYSGEFGGDDGLCQMSNQSDQQATFVYPHTIKYGDNMTIVARLDPNGSLVFPTQWERRWQRLLDNSVFLPLILPGLILGIWWWFKGRDLEYVNRNVFNHDPERAQARAPAFSLRQPPYVYEPLPDLTPGQAGAILRERVSVRDIVAEIVELARKKLITIERKEEKQLIGKKTEYVFSRTKKAAKQLPQYQTYLLEHLFKKGNTVKMSDLKGDFYTHFEKVKQLIMQSLHDKGLFTAAPIKIRGLAFAAVAVLSTPTGIWMFRLLDWRLWLAAPLFVISLVVALLCAYWMPAKTAKGRNYLLQAQGLQRCLRSSAWREKIYEKHLFFEEILSFAIALGVVDQLSKDMAALQVEPPEYLPVGSARSFTTAHFVNSFASQASSTLAYNPSSSSRGSGSGFSGGSSGGGGGGGGGGSW